MSEDISDPTNKHPASPSPPVAGSLELPLSASTPVAVSQFATHVIWTFAVRVLMVANSIVAGIIVARWLGAEGLGQVAVINVTVATVVQLASLGLPSANTYFIAKDRRHLRAASVNSLVFAIAAGGFLALGLVGLAFWRPAWFGFIPASLLGVAAISIPFQLITLVGLNIFLALGRIERFNLLDLAGQAFVLVNALVALVIMSAGLWTLISLTTASTTLIGLLIVFLIAKYGEKLRDKSPWRPDWKLFSRMLRYGIKFHISILAGALIFRADLLVVNYFRGAAEAGVYSVASQVAMALMLLPGVIGTLLFPRVAAEEDLRGETTCLVSRHTVFVLLFCCFAAIPLSHLLPILYGSAFADVTVQLLILLPGVFLIGIESVLVQHLNAIGLPRAVPWYWIATLITNVLLVFALVPRFGARGAALASTVSYALIFILIARHFASHTGRPLADAFLLSGSELRRLLTLRGLGSPKGAR